MDVGKVKKLGKNGDFDAETQRRRDKRREATTSFF
jgi:hypothetical protein